MKLLGILGSPRRGGNSEILLDKALEGARSKGLSAEKIVLNELKFVGCQECGGCAKTGECIVKDDMQDVYKKIAATDAIVIVSPIFFGSLPSQIKAMIDRYQCLWRARYLLKKKLSLKCKKGSLILVSAANKSKFFKNAESIIKNFFAILGVEFAQGLYCPSIDEKAGILKHPQYLKQAFELGEKLL